MNSAYSAALIDVWYVWCEGAADLHLFSLSRFNQGYRITSQIRSSKEWVTLHGVHVQGWICMPPLDACLWMSQLLAWERKPSSGEVKKTGRSKDEVPSSGLGEGLGVAWPALKLARTQAASAIWCMSIQRGSEHMHTVHVIMHANAIFDFCTALISKVAVVLKKKCKCGSSAKLNLLRSEAQWRSTGRLLSSGVKACTAV